MKINSKDTITAISTPPGENGIGIVRLSGPSALSIADEVFIPRNGKTPSEFNSHTIHYGHIADNGNKIDEVLLTVMRAPSTYTREDIIEINCHGGITAIKQVLDLLVSNGARLAEPGEFTKRAFLNGRIDLMQAEAVLDIINSRTKEGLRVAQRQLDGKASERIKKIRSEFIKTAAEIEADINFPEEDIMPKKAASIKESLKDIEESLIELINSAEQGMVLRNGITTVICGKPNVGKSTLMNSFLKQDRVIVTPIAGTTRDTIEEIINIRGIPLRIIDTAGIIHAEDELTKESVSRSRRYMEAADLILLVLDSSDRLTEHDIELIDIVKEKKVLVVVNKTDLPEILQIDQIKTHLSNKVIIKVSAKQGSGIKELENAIFNMFWTGKISAENIFISNSRHLEAAKKALDYTKSAVRGIDEKRPWEVISVDINASADALGIITGEVFTEGLLDAIFNNFCIGK